MADRKQVAEPPRMCSGCDLIDLMLGGAPGKRGLPFGVILSLIGDKSSGKSFLKNEMMAASYWRYRDQFHWFSDDTESGDTFDTTGLYGVNLRPMDDDKCMCIGKNRVRDSATVEELDAKLSMFIDHMNTVGGVGIYAVDSLDGLSDASREAGEQKRLKLLEEGKAVQDPGDYGAQLAKFLSQQLFRVKHQKLEDCHATLILVSQLRENFGGGPYAPKWSVAAGKALEFYAHTRVFLRTIMKITQDGDIIGAYVEASTLKSKTPRPFRKVRYSVYFDYGIDNIGSDLDYLYDLRDEKGALKKNAECIAWDGKADANLANLQSWLEKTGLKDECRAAKKAAGQGSNLSVEFVKNWVSENPDRQKEYQLTFGQTHTRDELIALMDKDKAMATELTRRVQEKWEAHEKSIATNRGCKYGE